MRKIGNIIVNITTALGAMCGGITFALCVLCIFTPYKTKYNQFTDVIKYWTDDVYFCENFNCPETLAERN